MKKKRQKEYEVVRGWSEVGTLESLKAKQN